MEMEQKSNIDMFPLSLCLYSCCYNTEPLSIPQRSFSGSAKYLEFHKRDQGLYKGVLIPQWLQIA